MPARPGAVLRLLAFIATALCLHSTPPEQGLPSVRNFPPRAYHGGNQIWRGAAMPDGTMLFAADGKVFVFDGESWTPIPIPNGSFVRGMDVDRDGVAWVGAVDELGRIDRLPDGSRKFTSLRRQVPGWVGPLQEIWKVYATDQGVWFQSNAAVLRYRDGKFDVWKMGERAIVLSYWLGDHLLVARLNGWFTPVDGGGWRELGTPAGHLADYLPHFAVPHPRGGWLMGIEGPHGESLGMARWDGQHLAFESHPYDRDLRTHRIYSAERLSDGRILITTLQAGALVLSPDLEFETLLDRGAGLPSDVVISSAEEAGDVVWLGTEFGLSRLDFDPAFQWFDERNGLPPAGGHPLVRWNGELLIGGSQGIVGYQAPKALPANGHFAHWGDLDDMVRTMVPAGDTVLVGGGGGLWYLRGNHAELVHHLTNVFAIAPSARTPCAWVASLNGLAWCHRQGDRWIYDTVMADLRSNSVAEAADGGIWLGTDNRGAFRVEAPPAGSVPAGPLPYHRYGKESGLPPGRVAMSVVGGIPTALTSAGLFRFDPAARRFVTDDRFGPQFADGSVGVHDLIEDGSGGAWIDAVDGEGQTVAIGHGRQGRWEPLVVPDNVLLEGNHDLAIERVGGRDILWINGESALLRVDVAAAKAHPRTAAGATTIRGIATAAGRALPIAPAVTLAADETGIRFRFGTLALGGDPDVEHETRLLGWGRGEAEISSALERTYLGLRPGRYRFEVRARGYDGRWSEPAAVTLTLLAPWWQTLWAWCGYFVCAACGFWGVVRVRTRLLESERTALEGIVAARTTELALKNRELERLNRLEQDEKLAARLAEEKTRLELLRYQLNPHFLFNSLNSIRALVYAQPEAAGEMVTRLAEFCRRTLAKGSDDLTTLHEELEMIRTYLEIEKARWQDALAVEIVADPAALPVRIPQFLLLPLIENAIKYGGRTSPALLQVKVTARAEGGILRCEVANTGTWVESSGVSSPTSTHIGLENLRQRLVRYYGAAGALKIVPGDGWVRLRLVLPFTS